MIRALLLAALLATPALADGLRIVDGDTFAIHGETIRLSNIDTPELRARCEAERIGAHLAKRRLGDLLRGSVVIHREGLDRYGRTLATVTADGMDVGERMVAEGYARPWEGRRRPWC